MPCTLRTRSAHSLRFVIGLCPSRRREPTLARAWQPGGGWESRAGPLGDKGLITTGCRVLLGAGAIRILLRSGACSDQGHRTDSGPHTADSSWRSWASTTARTHPRPYLTHPSRAAVISPNSTPCWDARGNDGLAGWVGPGRPEFRTTGSDQPVAGRKTRQADSLPAPWAG